MYCKLQLVQLQRDAPAIAKAGYGLAAISYDRPGVLQEFARRRAIQFPLLSDPDSRVIGAFGVRNRDFRPGMGLDVDRERIMLDAMGYVPAFGMAYPSVFVLDPAGRVEWRAVSLGSELRLTGAAILARSASVFPAAQRQTTAGGILITTAASNSAAGLGNRIVLETRLTIPAGQHVYASGATAPYRALRWTMAESQCWIAGEAEAPAGRPAAMPFDEAPQPVLEGAVRLTRELAVTPMLRAGDPRVFEWFRANCLDSAGKLRAKGELSFQACDDRQCFPPRTVPFEWTFQYEALDRERVSQQNRREFDQ